MSDYAPNHTVAGADSLLNTLVAHVIGNKLDTVAGNSVISLLRQLLAGGVARQTLINQVIASFDGFRDAYDVQEITQELHVVAGVGPVAANILQVTGSVLVLDQYAVLTEVNALTNFTDVWATMYSGGADRDPLTKGNPGGADLSNMPVGSFFTRGHVVTSPYDVIDATHAAMFEPTGPRVGSSFTATQGTGGVDSFLRIKGTAGAPVDFKMEVTFQWAPLDGGTLVFV
jgi:hypothetical protein